MPEVQQLVAETEFAQSGSDSFGIEYRLDVVVTQIGGDMHHFQAGFVAQYFERFIDRQIERHRRAIDPAIQGVARHNGIGQHGDLVARHIDRGQASPGDPIKRRSMGDAEPGSGDVNTDATADTRQFGDRQSIVDFGGICLLYTSRCV